MNTTWHIKRRVKKRVSTKNWKWRRWRSPEVLLSALISCCRCYRHLTTHDSSIQCLGAGKSIEKFYIHKTHTHFTFCPLKTLTVRPKYLIELRQIGENAQFVGHFISHHIVWIEQRWNVEILFSDAKCLLIILVNVFFLQIFKITVGECKMMMRSLRWWK